MLARTRPGELERIADAPLDAHPCVHRALRGNFVRRALPQEPALARVHTFGVLADDDEVDVGVASVGRGDERAVVHVEIELEAHAEEDAALHDPASLARGRAHRAEEHRVELAHGLEVLVGEDRAVTFVAFPAQVERGRLVADAGRVEALDGLGDDLGADAVSPDDPDAIGHVVLPRVSSRCAANSFWQRKTARLRCTRSGRLSANAGCRRSLRNNDDGCGCALHEPTILPERTALHVNSVRRAENAVQSRE